MKQKDANILMEDKEKVYKEISLKEKMRAKCDHKRVTKHGEVTLLKPMGGNGNRVMCSLCGAKFDLEPMNKGDIKKSADVLLNALHTIKATVEDPADSMLEAFAELQLALTKIPDWYENQYLDQLATNEYTNDSFESDNGSMFLSTGNTPFALGGREVYKNHKNHKGGKNKNKKYKDDYKKRDRGTNFWDLCK